MEEYDTTDISLDKPLETKDASGVEGAKEGDIKKKKKKRKKLILDVLIYFIIIFGIIYGLPKLLVFALDTQFPMAAITSGSMWPVLKEGDLVLIQGVERGEYDVGDIIVFQSRVNNTLTIHRVVKLGENKITTKGDANFGEDAPVDYSDVIGKTFNLRGKPVRIPYLGSITVFASKFRQNGVQSQSQSE